MRKGVRAVPIMRGQAAVEYLITYAWVFVAIAIIIGILYSLVGVREIHIHEACTAAPGWWCDVPRFAIRDEQLVGAQRRLIINGSIANALGFAVVPVELNITIVAPTLTGTYTLRGATCGGPRPCGGYAAPSLIAPGRELAIYLAIPYSGEPIPSGTMFRIQFALAYNSTVTGTALRTAGTLYRRTA